MMKVAQGAAVQSRVTSLLGANLSIQNIHRPVSAEVGDFCGRSLRFALLRLSPHKTVARGAPLTAESRVLVSFHMEGDAVVSQNGRESAVTPGSFFVVDPAAAFEIDTGDMETRSVYLLRSTLVQLMPELPALTAVPISCESGAAAVLRSAVDALFDRAAANLDAESAESIGEALPHLLAAALRPAAGTAHLPSKLRLMHKERIRRYVRQHLADSELDPAAIAQAVHLSPRHVHDLFADESEPLMKWVWSERLEQCRRELADPRLARRSVSEIAYAWGFSDMSHFSRAFKGRHGLAPREFRARAIQGAAPLAA
jgi:AraC-like DNA-binding protein